MSNVLEKIISKKHEEIAAAKRRLPLAALEQQLDSAPPVRDFVASIRSSDRMGLIAEVKKASPSAGVIRDDFDPVTIATAYERHGANCISVLTDESFFQGHLDHLRAVRASVNIPVLRKDFLIDPYQVVEARVAGADCILLIAECLTPARLGDLYRQSLQLGMNVLIEIYDPENLAPVLELQPTLLGVNNRNLRTFVTDLRHTLDLVEQVPKSTSLISESGIATREDVACLQKAGVRGILVGETLMRSSDVGAKIRELLGE